MAALCAAMLVLLACGCRSAASRDVVAVDSLNALSYGRRFTSAHESMRYADEVISRYSGCGYADGVHLAWLNKAYAHYMLMRYDSVRVCCDVVMRQSRNDMLRILADVNMMLTSNMLGQSKEFYDYRNDARERLTRLMEDPVSAESRAEVLASVMAQYHMASLHYFVRMRLTDEVNESEEWLESNQELFDDDPTLVANHLMLRSMLNIQGSGTGEDNLTQQRRMLLELLLLSLENGYDYITAEALHRLSRSIVSSGQLRPAITAYLMDMLKVGDADSLGLALDMRALRMFEQYGNSYTISRALITLSDYKLREGKTDEALAPLVRALGLVNEHHRLLASAMHPEGEEGDAAPGADTLSATPPQGEWIGVEALSTEMLWIADPGVMAVPVWMQNVREQLSVVYGAMGLKDESDYNHNIYFDILDATRQDQRVEQERELLDSEEGKLNALIVVFVAALLLMAWGIYVFNRRSRRRYERRVARLEEVIAACKRMVGVLSEGVDDEEELERKLAGIDIQPRQGDSFDSVLMSMQGVCRSWVKDMGLKLISFADSQRRVEGETFALEKKYEEEKRLYMEKLVSMSIVNGITPFLDRALHEVAHHADGSAYLAELIDRINYYNDILGHWVKIRQGEVTLSIESFALRPLLDTLRLGTKAFAAKGITLSVADSDAVVKADRGLTLFMMNTLLDNARKYTPEGGTVSLAAQEVDGCVEIAVEDTGHGMSADDVATINGQKVYDSSTIGADSEEVRAQKGFGFGLMNCRGIIEKYRKTNALFSVCQFGVESEPGKGSRFFFRLPKGVLKTFAALIIYIMSAPVLALKPVEQDPFIEQVEYYYDCQFSANVEGDYEAAIEYADSAIAMLNACYLSRVPEGATLMHLDGGTMAELDWWRDGFGIDYELIINIRNEAAISALALNRNSLYHYNAECFKRLYTLANTDHTMEQYCADARQANRNRRAIAIALGLTIAAVLIIYFFIWYRRYQLFIFNIRQFIELKAQDPTHTPADVGEGRGGVEALILGLMRELAEAQEHIARHKMAEQSELLELKEDERRRMDREQQRMHVQNMIMDNCMSALKHETMYYPNRIKQIISQADVRWDEVSELMAYYKQVFTLLSACAGKQVERVLFKRTTAAAGTIGDMARRAHKRAAQKDRSLGRLVEEGKGKEMKVVLDKTFMQMLVANIVSLYQEHRSGGDLLLSYEDMDGRFVRFTFTDTAHAIDPADAASLFYVDSVKYDPQRDALVGMQYLIAKQIIREHDSHSAHRGCRIYVEPTSDGAGSRFVFTLQKA